MARRVDKLLEELLAEEYRELVETEGPKEKKNVGLNLTVEYHKKMQMYYGRNLSKLVDEFFQDSVEAIEKKLREAGKEIPDPDQT